VTDDTKMLLEHALRLPPKERAELAARLVSSINAVSEAEEAWNQLIAERARRVAGQELGTITYLRGGPPVRVRFELDAEVDIERAASWYADQPGQMEAFLQHVQDALELVQKNPGGFGFHGGVPQGLGVRRVYLREFPYAIAFVRVRNQIRVLAVAHGFRSPSEGEITLPALITVEDWLQASGLRALSILAVGASAAVIAH